MDAELLSCPKCKCKNKKWIELGSIIKCANPNCNSWFVISLMPNDKKIKDNDPEE